MSEESNETNKTISIEKPEELTTPAKPVSKAAGTNLKGQKRFFKGEIVESFLACRHNFRVSRVDGIRNNTAVNATCKLLDIEEDEAADLLGGKFEVSVDKKAATLNYLYVPIKKD